MTWRLPCLFRVHLSCDRSLVRCSRQGEKVNFMLLKALQIESAAAKTFTTIISLIKQFLCSLKKDIFVRMSWLSWHIMTFQERHTMTFQETHVMTFCENKCFCCHASKQSQWLISDITSFIGVLYNFFNALPALLLCSNLMKSFWCYPQHFSCGGQSCALNPDVIHVKGL